MYLIQLQQTEKHWYFLNNELAQLKSNIESTAGDSTPPTTENTSLIEARVLLTMNSEFTKIFLDMNFIIQYT